MTTTTTSTVNDAAGNAFRTLDVRCPVCEKRNAKTLGMRGGRYHRNGKGIEAKVVQCRTCDMIWSEPFFVPVSPSELYGDPSKYFESKNEAGVIEKFRRTVLQRAEELSGNPTPSILDVGSGRSELIRAALAAGCKDVVGLEFCEGMIDYARDKLGISLIAETIEQYAEHAARTFDLVVLSAVMEHVYDPDAMIGAAARMTRPGSLLYIDVPNEASLLGHVINASFKLRGSPAVAHLAPTWPPFHVWGFCEKSMKKLLEKHGFSVVSCVKYSEMGFEYPPGIKGKAIKAAAKAFGAAANATGTAVNMYTWARKL